MPDSSSSVGSQTRKRILQAALELYNAHGLFNSHGKQVTARKIAEVAAMTDGNLRYHFKTREDIVVALYEQLVGKMDQIFTDLANKPPSLALMGEAMLGMYTHLATYRFLMLDFTGVMRRIPHIREQYRALQQRRKQQFQGFWALFTAAGLIRGNIPPEHIEGVVERLQILSDFWLPNAEHLFTGDTAAATRYYARLTMESLYPYLTPKGEAAWNEAFSTASWK